MNRETTNEESANSGLVPQLGMMVRALWASPVRNRLILLSGALFLGIAVTAYGQIRLNNWNQPFYDALSHRDFAQFLVQLGVFALIAGALLILNVAQRWLTETLKLKLRRGLALDLIHNWMQPGRAFRLANAGPMGVNPDQRMHEDARHLTELSADLGIGLVQSSILLATFVAVLWSLSNNFVFHVGDRHFTVPGYMVWAAVVYSGSASLLSYWVGKNLIGRNAERYAREADMRFSLVRVNEHIDAIALGAGEADEERRIEIDLAAVLAATARLVTGLTNLTWVTAGYGWFTLVAPILVAAPLYFAGNISFGGLMMASGAFMQVQSSLRWFVDNFSTIADWRATLLRVAGFRRAVIDTDVLHDVHGRIAIVAGDPGKIRIDDLEIASPAGATMLQEKKIEIGAGERVLIIGESGTGKTLLFRALAGLWPWGAGQIAAPARRTIALYAAHPLPSSRHFARGPRLSVADCRVRDRRLYECPGPPQARSPGAHAGCIPALGPGIERGRAADGRFRASAAALAVLAVHRRGAGLARRGCAAQRARYPCKGPAAHRRDSHRPRRCARSCVFTRAAPGQGPDAAPAGQSRAATGRVML